MPVGRPANGHVLCAVAGAAAAACASVAALWQGMGGWAFVALLLVPAGLLHSARSGLSPVSALRTATGAGRWQVRQPQGWQDARLLDQQRGPRWLTLTLQLLPTGSTVFTNSTITLTVWQRTLQPESWRRLCLLTGTAQRARQAARPQEAS
ncbi:hypothetical protein YH64_000665 [Achromobacter sp. LC458]|uniref:Uncharacterized protein n=1 Tax=Achromobacter spanius TaxID=217203 RepID=A0A2S5GU75_9BURK|nr:hypothetical protein DVB37_05995 [Achromobacter sp. B7]PPA76637.1 hypothetical protein C4E15_07595 [Achromobacter spanius]TRM54801.1 hypothetical protein YH64_000665 [Achromobacter sp. LC458]HBL66655.1 hypothetical protein [Achromobacter sp.]HCQ45518.1 hypothetical protein [Achromobacter sp.]